MAYGQADHRCERGSNNFNRILKTSMVLSCLATGVKGIGIYGLTVTGQVTR